MDKSTLRKEILKERDGMTDQAVENLSKTITEMFLDSDYYKNFDVIYTYVSYNHEVVTDDIIKRAWKDGKKVAVPKVFGDNMAFCYIESFADLAPGYNGIMEPVSEKIAYDDKVLMLTPGLAFDRNFNRIGYGKGYYDKFLDRNMCEKFFKVALCYEFQLVDEIECEEHDEKVQVIITPDVILENK